MKVNLKNPGSSCLSITRTYDNRMTERVKTENSENVKCILCGGIVAGEVLLGRLFFFSFYFIEGAISAVVKYCR